jgi:hypothetical protein
MPEAAVQMVLVFKQLAVGAVEAMEVILQLLDRQTQVVAVVVQAQQLALAALAS